MKTKIISILAMIVALFIIPTFATQQSILSWEFEEGIGSIAIDTSGNNYHGIFYGGTNYNVNSRWGTYSTEYDNANDYIIGNINTQITPQISLSFWIYPFGTERDIPIAIYDENYLMQFGIIGDANGDKAIYYYDTNGIYREGLFTTNPFSINTWHHIVINIDFNSSFAEMYANNNYIGNISLSSPQKTNYDYRFIIGTDQYQNSDFFGYLDAVKLFNFNANSSQVSELFTTNTITFKVEENNETEPEINDTQIDSIITSLIPTNGSSIQNPINFQMMLKKQADCDLYIDNKIAKSFNNAVAYNYNTNINVGSHSYFVYCSYIENNTLMYELSEIIQFEVLPSSPSTINFLVYSSEFDVNDEGLYITTPCLKQGIFVAGVSNGYNHVRNPNPIYIQKVTNGVASFTLIPEKHEFCLVNGRIFYDTNGYTDKWEANEVYNNIDLGEYTLPSNVTSTYSIGLERFDAYKPWNPKAWGQTWASIISSLLAVLIGGLLVWLSVLDKNNPKPQLALVGGLLIMFGLGYQISNLVLGVLV